MSSTALLGKVVPDFTAQATGGEPLQLKTLRGKNVVLYFYPRDNTPGCTTEGHDFNALNDRFARAGTVILGVSRDTLASHEKFATKLGLAFRLLADTDGALCNLFNVIREKNMYGRKVKGIERSTFLIDREGRLQREWRKVRIDGHAAEVLAAARAL